MAFSKICANVSLFRTLPVLTDSSRLLRIRTCAFELCRQTDSSANFVQKNGISTSLCCHDRSIGRKNTILFSRLKDNVEKSDSLKRSEQQTRVKSSQINGSKDDKEKKNGKEDEKKEGIIQRFKKAYKEHGKILVGVHVATSIVWLGTFWYTVHVGVDVVGFLERIGISERILNPMRNSGAGDLAVAYLMYKLATPARYTVTLAGTNYAIKYLRKVGKMAPQKEKMRDLVRDSSKALKKTEISEELSHKLKTVHKKSKSRVLSMRGKSQRRLVQLRNFFRSTRKRKR